MRVLPLALVLTVLSGCASLHTEVFEKVQKGDSASSVTDLLGTPDEMQGAGSEGSVWIYKRRRDICSIQIKNDAVAGYSCSENPNYVNPVGAILKGAGDGLKSGSSQPTQMHCTPDYAGGYNCQGN